jgi:methylenetetrahydrofolate reductase (NADPH)
MQRLADAGDKVAEEGIKIAVETIVRLRGKKGVSGVHIMPLGWEAAVPYIIKSVEAGLRPASTSTIL